jgi:Ca2+-dependent lipid-binding protein
MHRQRAEAENHKAGKGYPPESVEWLNAVVATIWGLIDPSLFNPTSNLVEDVMQASLPKLVDAVRISQVGQGRNPFRIVSMRKLPRRGKRAGV